MKKSEIEQQDRMMLTRQREFRMAADVVTDAWMRFPEVEAVAVIGSVAKRLWKEVPRFREFRRLHIEIWHECVDLDIALWLHSQDRLHALQRAGSQALREAFEGHRGMSVIMNQLDIFLFEPVSDRYLGRLCRFNQCPKGKIDCMTPGCGEIPFNKCIAEFKPRTDLLASTDYSTLYRRGIGRLRSALDFPTVDSDQSPPPGGTPRSK